MIKGDYDDMVNLAKFNVCAEHKGPLEVAWDSQGDTYFLRCGVCEATDAITRKQSNTGEWRAGAPGPGEFVQKDLESAGINSPLKGRPALPMILGGIPKTDLATGEALLPELINALVEYAYKYNLDPVRGHVCMMYGQPYITIDGYLYHASRSNQEYEINTRPLTDDERPSYMLGQGDHAWLCEIIMGRGERRFNGLGVVTSLEMTEKSTKKPDKLRSPVVAAKPWQLAQKRAEWQALRRAFPIGGEE